MRDPAIHVWPAFPVNTAIAVTPYAAASRSASSNTMLADLPPNSKCNGFSVGAARSEMMRAVSAEPVKLMRPTRGSRTSASPASSPSPATMFTTPGGMPASSRSSPKRSNEHDACSAGFNTTVLPAASAAPSFATAIVNGAFHGTINPTTPMGSRKVKLTLLGPICTVSPLILSAAPAK
jgi:hypothetical protein